MNIELLDKDKGADVCKAPGCLRGAGRVSGFCRLHTEVVCENCGASGWEHTEVLDREGRSFQVCPTAIYKEIY